ncbi:circadian oscillation regulator KaiB [Halorhodospira halochloris]|uniref:Circadian oscillation regulator KaiB n=1 Tax=Halorhodospira halochloris TaxID=1052 RepID=A0A0X8X692_HALHR|nr:circadian clock KaiB family protein [Halorhodospira halochloris]MBK1652450.1 hypothetical protein [Halorhodospira halochloris]BAU56344.1 circadian oscillation regulator KaiB [Halorhodospira halochloris]
MVEYHQHAEYWLRIFVVGDSPQAYKAIRNLHWLCNEYLCEQAYHIEVIDLCCEPEKGDSEKIVATPTLIREAPRPPLRVIGDLANAERVAELLLQHSGCEED